MHYDREFTNAQRLDAQMTDLLTTKQVQSLLRLDRTTIYRMVESGKLPAIRVGKQWRFVQSDVERWLRSGRTLTEPTPVARPVADTVGGADVRADNDLRSLLPLACIQLMQDTFAEMLGVMMVVTDMRGIPVTQISNPCDFFATLSQQDPQLVAQCVSTWQQLAGDPSLAPKFSTSELDLLCARGLIRVGAELKGMVVLGGVAPEVWPPSAERIAAMAQALGLDPDTIRAEIHGVYRLDRANQARALHFVQRIADIFSHIIEDRGRVQGRPAA